jgi:hypothetical protein
MMGDDGAVVKWYVAEKKEFKKEDARKKRTKRREEPGQPNRLIVISLPKWEKEWWCRWTDQFQIRGPRTKGQGKGGEGKIRTVTNSLLRRY